MKLNKKTSVIVELHFVQHQPTTLQPLFLQKPTIVIPAQTRDCHASEGWHPVLKVKTFDSD